MKHIAAEIKRHTFDPDKSKLFPQDGLGLIENLET